MTVFCFAAYVKIATRDLMLSASQDALVNAAAADAAQVVSGNETDKAYLAVTIAMAALPLATSITAFYLGWLSSDPVVADINKHRLYIARMQDHRASLAATRAEAGAPEAHRAQLIKREKELYADKLRQNAANEELVNASTAEAFFTGRSADDITIISNRSIAKASYEPKASTLADTEETTEQDTETYHMYDRVKAIPVR